MHVCCIHCTLLEAGGRVGGEGGGGWELDFQERV